MVKIDIRYEGGLRCAATHGPSGQTLRTDAPVDNHGRGETFSPTDLVAAALGSCMATIMGIVADRHEIDLRGMAIEVTKTMSASAPRRIARLATTIRIPLPPSHPQRVLLERAALTCPVHRSLSAEMEKPVDFVWIG
jgi:putative redox protein